MDETAVEGDTGADEGATGHLVEAPVVLVTGCSSGIGAATARAFREEEWTVYASARDTEDLTDLPDCEHVELDVTDPHECEAAVERVVEAEGRIDCLVNNAGYAQYGPLEDVPPRKVHRQFDVNVYGPHRLIRHALPHMRDQEAGTVVNVSSVYGRLVTPGAGAYAASKHALEAMSDALRAEAGEFGVDVVVVEPGPVETPFAERAERELEGFSRSGAYDALYDFLEDRRTLSDVGAVPPEDVAEVVRDAAVDPDPEPRYAVGEVAKLSMFARYVPDRWRDAAFSLVGRLIR